MDRERSTRIAICLALTAITLVVFGQVWRFDFTEFDDQTYVVGFSLVHKGLAPEGIGEAFTSFRAGNWHPLTWLSLMADWQFFGKNAGAFHLVNLALHLANVLLLFTALRHMTGQPWRSGLVAALFAIHPLHVESVAWVSERKDVLSTLFWMLALWSYSHYARGGSLKWYLVVFVSLALGLMAKPMLVTLPCVLLLLDYWPLGRWSPSGAKRASQADEQRPRRAGRRQPPEALTSKRDNTSHQVHGSSPPASLKTLIVEKLPLFALVAASCVMTLFAQRYAMAAIEKMSLAERLSNAALAYVTYLKQTFWPVDLACFYPYRVTYWTSPTFVLATLFLIGATVAAIKARRSPWLLVGWLWYLGTLVPVIGVVQVGGQAMADRYTYVPLIGVFLMGIWSLPARIRESYRALAVATAGVVIGGLMFLSWKQVGYWRNTTTLFEHALKVTERNWVAHVNLGFVCQKQGRLPEATKHYETALQIAPSCAMAHTLLADMANDRGDNVAAIRHGLAAIASNPNIAEAHGIVGLVLAKQGQFAEAIKHLQTAVRLAPDHVQFHYYLGLALLDSGKLAEAADELRTAIRLQPSHTQAHNELGSVLARQGHSEQAIGHFREALRFDPQHPQAQQNLKNEVDRLRKQ